MANNTKKLIKLAAKTYNAELSFTTDKSNHLWAYVDGVCLNTATNRNRGYSQTGPGKDRFETFVKDDLRRYFR